MEAIQTGLRGVLRLILAILVILAFFANAFFQKFKHRKNPLARREAFARNSQAHCALMARVFNIHITVKGEHIAESNFLYVGNHMGFVDIFVVSSLFPALFITSQEMRETPLLGSLCEMAGCIFVERRSRTKIMNELGSLTEALKQGFNVVLYPEATSTNGEQVLPFKKTLIMSAPHAGRPIQPGCVNFVEVNGQEFSLKTRDHVCWYGDMSFVQAMWGSLTASTIKVEVEFLEPIMASPEMDRSVVTEQAYKAVKARYRPVGQTEAATSFAAAVEES